MGTPTRGTCRGGRVVRPYDLRGDTPVLMYVSRFGEDHYLVSDRRFVCDWLDMFGANVGSSGVSLSWQAVVGDLQVVMAETHDWEIAATTDAAHLGETMLVVASRQVQADSLYVLHPKTFKEKVIRCAGETGLAVSPEAHIFTRQGGECQVSFIAKGEGGTAYVNTLDGKSFMANHDRAFTIFASADIPKSQKNCLVLSSVKDHEWQTRELEDVSTVLEEARDELWVFLY